MLDSSSIATNRVLLISFSELPTLQRYLYLLQGCLEEMGVDTWTIGSSNVAIARIANNNNIFFETPNSPKPSFSSLGALKASLSAIADKIVEIDPELIHFVNKHTWNFFLICSLKKRLPKAKIVHTFHDPVGHAGDSVQKGVILYHKIVQRLLDGIVVHSAIAKKQAVEQLKPKCSVYHAPLGATEWRSFHQPRLTNKVLIFGHINFYKGVKYYPSILDELYALDDRIEVVIAGKAADEIDEELLKEIEGKPNCSLRNGFIAEADIDNLFEEASIVLVPYTSITQSGVILDAYSRSRAVVCFDIPGIGQYVPDEKCRVPAFDCKALAGRVGLLLSSKSELTRASKDAWDYGRNNFTPQSMARSLLDSYEAIEGRRP